MEITTRSVDDVTVVDISGSLDTQTSGAASEEMARIAQNATKMLLNLESLDFDIGILIDQPLLNGLRIHAPTIVVCWLEPVNSITNILLPCCQNMLSHRLDALWPEDLQRLISTHYPGRKY